jgi:hypothetical protein
MNSQARVTTPHQDAITATEAPNRSGIAANQAKLPGAGPDWTGVNGATPGIQPVFNVSQISTGNPKPFVNQAENLPGTPEPAPPSLHFSQ